MARRRPFDLPSRVGNSRGARSVQRILEAAANLFGRDGFAAASMNEVARAAGVSKGLLHYHFESKEHLLIEAQRATFRQIFMRFSERFERGDHGVATAVDALDALWESLVAMKAWTPFMVETISQAVADRPVRPAVDAFYDDAMGLLLQGIERTFERERDQMAVSPERLARMVRVNMHGLIVELARARDEEELARVEQTYRDLRDMFARVILEESGEMTHVEADEDSTD